MKTSGRTIIILLGAPGAGKGTQAEALTDWLGIPHISSGELLRRETANESPLGLRVRAGVDGGGLVSDEDVNELVAARICNSDCKYGFVLDGYPRTVCQAVAFQKRQVQGDCQIVIDIEVDAEQIIQRLTRRLTCRECGAVFHQITSPPRQPGTCDRCGAGGLTQRFDDRMEVIRDRFHSYYRSTEPLTKFYRTCAGYHRINGMQPPETIAVEVRRIVESKNSLRNPQHSHWPNVAGPTDPRQRLLAVSASI